MASLPCDLDQLQQSLLERLGPEFDRAEDDVGTGIGPAGPPQLLLESLWVVADEVAALPVAVEDRTELGDNVRVARGRDPHVPLEPGHLSGVRQVRRPDVGGREPRTTMEYPRLRMKARRADVVGDANVGAQVCELVERPPFGRAGVRRREHPQWLPGLAMPSEHLGERVDPTATDEGHHQIDLVRRLDLRAKLVHQVRFAGRAGEQRRVEQRDEWLVDRLCRTIRPAAQDRVEHGGRIDGHGGGIDLDQFPEPIQQGSGDSKADLDPVLLGDVAERGVDLAAQVPRDPIRGLGRAERALLDGQLVGERVELRLQPLRDERLVQSRAQLIHAGKLRAERDVVVGTGLTPAARAREGSAGGTRR